MQYKGLDNLVAILYKLYLFFFEIIRFIFVAVKLNFSENVYKRKRKNVCGSACSRNGWLSSTSKICSSSFDK